MIEVSALIILVVFLICLLIGLPVAVAISVPAIIAIFMNGLEFKIVPQSIISGVQSYTLLAVPFFLLAGNLMTQAGIARRIFEFCLTLVGHVKGGLAHVNIMASVIFGGISGSALADAAGLGKVQIKEMSRVGYRTDFSAAITAVSAIIAGIIPPSLIMIVYASEAQVSVGAMFKAGLVPGILCGLFLMIMVMIFAKRGASFPDPSQRSSFKDIFKTFKHAFFSLIAPVIILAGIFSGVFTATEAGVVAVVYAIILGFVYGEIRWDNLFEVFKDSAIGTAQVMFMTASATLLGWVITYMRIPAQLSEIIFSFTDSPIAFLLIANLFMLVVGGFIESIAGMLILLPILLPMAIQFGIDPVHFGIIACVNMLIGAVTPPFGTILYTVAAISEAKLDAIIRRMMPFFIAQLILLLIITFIPQVSLWLTNIL